MQGSISSLVKRAPTPKTNGPGREIRYPKLPDNVCMQPTTAVGTDSSLAYTAVVNTWCVLFVLTYWTSEGLQHAHYFMLGRLNSVLVFEEDRPNSLPVHLRKFSDQFIKVYIIVVEVQSCLYDASLVVFKLMSEDVVREDFGVTVEIPQLNHVRFKEQVTPRIIIVVIEFSEFPPDILGRHVYSRELLNEVAQNLKLVFKDVFCCFEVIFKFEKHPLNEFSRVLI